MSKSPSKAAAETATRLTLDKSVANDKLATIRRAIVNYTTNGIPANVTLDAIRIALGDE